MKTVSVHMDIPEETYNRLKGFTQSPPNFKGEPHEYIVLTAKVFVHPDRRNGQCVSVYELDENSHPTVLGKTVLRLEK